MPIISSASLALALAAFFWVTASAAGAAPQGFPTSAARVTVATQEGGRIILPAIEDASIAPGESVSAKELGEAPSVVAIVDTYPSLMGGMSYCQAGEEKFLRIFSTAKAKPAETFRLKVASCRDNLELADGGLQWNGDAHTISIDWLMGPSGHKETRELRVEADGAIR
jgi:hypothetical protein